MSINQQSYDYGAAKSSIREIAAYGAARKAEIGAQNVFDFSLGNPSIPAPDAVRDSIEHSLALPATALHGYTPANGLPAARAAVAESLNRRFGTAYSPDDLYLTCGAAASISIVLNAVCNEGEEVIVILGCPEDQIIFFADKFVVENDVSVVGDRTEDVGFRFHIV